MDLKWDQTSAQQTCSVGGSVKWGVTGTTLSLRPQRFKVNVEPLWGRSREGLSLGPWGGALCPLTGPRLDKGGGSNGRVRRTNGLLPCILFSSSIYFSSVQSLSHVQCFATPWTTAHQASLSITNSRSPPKPMSIESVMSSNHLICRGPASAGSRGYPQDERHRQKRQRERRHVRPALIGPSLSFTFWQPVLYPFTERFQGTRCLFMITQD